MLSKKLNTPDIDVHEYERKIKRYEIMLNQFTPQYDRLIESGTSIVRYLFIMNAGAILALLTFVGNEHIPCLFHKLQWSFKLLIGGIIASIGSGIAEFLRQDYLLGDFKRKFNEEPSHVKKTRKLISTLIITARFLGIVSLMTFIIAILNALRILSSTC